MLHIQERRRIICETPVLETMERGDREKEKMMVISSQRRLFAVRLVGADPCLSRGPCSGMWGFRQASEAWLELGGLGGFVSSWKSVGNSPGYQGWGSELSLGGTGTGELSPASHPPTQDVTHLLLEDKKLDPCGAWMKGRRQPP